MIRTPKQCSYRHDQKKVNTISSEKLLIIRNIWVLIVLARILSFLILFLSYYHERF